MVFRKYVVTNGTGIVRCVCVVSLCPGFALHPLSTS